MKDLIICLPSLSLLAQMPQQDSYERLGIAGISLGVTVFIWKYFVNKESAAQAKRDEDEKKAQAKRDEKEAEEKVERQKREAADIAERNRLLEVANHLQTENVTLQKQIVEMLTAQAIESAKVAATLVNTQRDFLKAHEDGQRSIKELARKIPSSRDVTIKNDAEHPVPTLSVEEPKQ